MKYPVLGIDCMRLYEYQAKQLFSSHGIVVPGSVLVRSQNDVKEAVNKLGLPVILKSQVLAGGRGKAGAIRKADSAPEALTIFSELIEKPVQGEKPSAILVEEFREHVRETYLSISLNRSEHCFVLLVSGEGGVDVEAIGRKATFSLPDSVVDKKSVSKETMRIGLDEDSANSIANIAVKMGELSAKIEAELVEINPLAITADGNAIALDAKIIVDDNALFRHPEIASLRMPSNLEAESQKYGFNFVELDGNIAVIGNGAGLVLSTLDMLVENGGRPACFLDLGGGATEDVVFAALRVVSRFDKAKGILLNVFGGITRTPDVAKAIKDAFFNGLIRGPFHARILGVGEEDAFAILQNLPVFLHRNIDEAIQKLIADVQRIQ
ncbi:MAG: succinate--CoA ligase subunit beta [Thaumarchaeota archaeon]|nr:succinate--CoA ligase subunit beta [Nitrososphaerota archaeon]